jgi:hypothetical protein
MSIESNNKEINLKLNPTDLEVLEKKVTFFPGLVDEVREFIPSKPVQQQVQPSPPPPNRFLMPTIKQNNSVIKPMSQMRGNGMRGIGMRMF